MINLLVERVVDPSPGQARSLMRHELIKPEYLKQNWVERLLAWLERVLNNGLDSASTFSPLSTFAAMLIAVLLVAGLAWLLTRARVSPRASTLTPAVLTDETVTAAQLRARAEAALAEGRNEEALLDGFRALAVRQVERGRLEDRPDTTAREAARVLAEEYPDHRSRVDGTALTFDLVLYGDRAASRDQVIDLLALDDELGSRR